MDFVTVRRPDGSWAAYAIELNLRKGCTTHPFLTLQFLTDGAYDPESAVFTAPSGRPKYFIASDHVESPSYRTLTADDLFDLAVRQASTSTSRGRRASSSHDERARRARLDRAHGVAESEDARPLRTGGRDVGRGIGGGAGRAALTRQLSGNGIGDRLKSVPLEPGSGTE
jgi:hypothetical protein